MKKIILSTLVACGAIFFNSCKGSKDCKCTTTYSGVGAENYEVTTETIPTLNATSNPDCSIYESVTENNGLMTTITCVQD